ncbi:MAG: hypothetical protein HY011_10540 [Acidobacteria bacterium]|nr:hypothetical protein [Acidobacteriota bacterium]
MKSPVLRFTLCSLITLCAVWQWLPGHAQSSNDHANSQNFAPDIATGVLGTAREGHTATLLQNGKVLVAGGRNGGAIFNSAEIYDPVNGQWAPTANAMTNARYGHTAVLLRSGLVLISGGQGGNGFLSSAELYDPSDNSWKPALNSQMNVARYHATATLLNNGRVLVVGGTNGNGAQRSAELYDPATRNWTRTDANNNSLGNLTDARAEHTATLLTDGRLLVAGGFNGTAALSTAELFEPNANRWRRAGDLLTARRLHTATLLPDGTALVAGGLNGATALGSSETFNPATLLWTAAGNLTARRSHTAVLLPNGRVVAVGGRDANGNPLGSVEAYNYTSRIWGSATAAPPANASDSFALANARGEHTATLLPNAQVLLAGGVGLSNTTLNSAELYEYARPSWNLTRDASNAVTQLNTARVGHSATLLPNGRVLVAGGYRISNGAVTNLRSAELYDPASGVWTSINAMETERAGHTATLLGNGKVLVAGGYVISGNAAAPLSSAALYDPVTGVWTPTPTMGQGRYRHTATLLPNGRVLVTGGYTAQNSALLYDPSAGAAGGWSSTTNLTNTGGRAEHSATLLPDGTVFIFGGLSSTNVRLNTGAIFNPATSNWANLSFSANSASQLPAVRFAHTATLLPGGRILIAGGFGPVSGGVQTVLGYSELYNIASQRFEIGNIITGSRVDHTATLLPNGRVLLVGGYTSSASTSNCLNPISAPQAALFDPSVPLGSSTSVVQFFDPLAPLQARNAHTASLLPNGDVLLAGGNEGEMTPACLAQGYLPNSLRESELYKLGLGYQENWRPTLSFIAASGNLFTVNGGHFQGISDASGHGAQSSASSYPVAQLRSLGNEQLAFIPLNSAAGWSNSSFNYNPFTGIPPGPALLTIYANGIPSTALVVAGNGGNLNTGAAPTGTISGRVLFHNGEGIAANLTLTPVPGAPAACSVARTLTAAPNGDFVFRDLVIAPTPTPAPTPTINCGTVQVTNTTSANGGLLVSYTNPTVSPAGTAVSCNPSSGSFFAYGVTTVTCTATNSGGTVSCSFPMTVSNIQCPPDQTRSTSGSSVAVTYPAPTVQPASFSATCTPASGAVFPLGTTTVTCRVTQNQNNTCTFRVIVQGTIGLQNPARGVEANPPAACSAVSIGAPGATELARESALQWLTPAPWRTLLTHGSLVQAIMLNNNTAVETLQQAMPPVASNPPALATAPEQTAACRYQVTPSAISSGQQIQFYPTSAIFNMTTGGVPSGPAARLAEPTQGGVSCFNCINNVFSTRGPTSTLGVAVLRQNGQAVSDVMLEFSVPYEIYDDRLSCKDNGNDDGNDVPCTIGAKTAKGDFCTKPSTNPLLSSPQDRCSCTSPLNPDGSCSKTILGHYPMPTNGTFTVSDVPNGANVVLKPGTVVNGANYTFSYQAASPPGLPPEDSIRLDRVLLSRDDLKITALTACTPATATITPSGPVSFCEGGSVMLTANGDAGATYRWFRDGTPTASNTKSITATQGGAYTVEFTDASGCASTRSAAVNVVVNPPPAKPAITPGGPTTFCEGGSVTLSAPAAAAYQWSNGATTQSINVTSAGSFTVRVTNASGCQSVVSDAVIVTVNSAPAKPTITANGPTTFCEGGSVNLTAPAGAASYQWSNGATSQTINVTTAGSFTVRVTNAGGCQSTPSDAVTVTVNAAPVKPSITPNGPTTFCEGGNVTLTAPAGAASYQWSNGATTQSINVTTAGNFTVRVTNASGCQSETSDALTITINPAPAKPAITPSGPTTFCEGGSVTLSAPAAAAYQWSNGATTQTINVSASGSFTVRITNASGCQSSTSDTLAVTVNPPPAKPTITANGSLMICEGQSVTLSAPAGAAAYLWSNGATTPSITVTAAGTFTVQITNASNCQSVVSDPATVTVNPPLNISAHPVSQAVCAGAAVTFSVTANGTAPLSYQWRKNGSALNGATGSSFMLNAAAANDAGSYDVVINSGCGMQTSNAAMLTLNAFALSANSASFTALGGTGFVDLTATVSQCAWTASSNADWLTISSGSSGAGNGRVNFNVAANTGTVSRSGVLTIAGLSFNVTETGTALAARIDALSQTSAVVGTPGLTLSLTGVNFTNIAKARWNGSERATSFVSATQLTATLTTADLAAPGTFTIDVFDPPPGGGASNQLSFIVQNPVPQITGLNPGSREAGGGQFTLTVNGASFVNGAVIRWNSADRTTTFVSATQLTAVIPATDIAAQGTATITVFNPAPGGGLSSDATFTINQAPNPVPVLTGLSPSALAAGGSQFTLTVNGSGFVNGSVVRWNNSERVTTFVSSTQLTAQIPASDIANAGNANVTVFSPAPGGGTSGAQGFTITTGATINSIVPDQVIAGGPGFILTVIGSNLTSGAMVRVNGNQRPTTVVNAMRVTAEIPASDIASPGVARITVALTGGSVSNEMLLNIVNATAHVSAASFTAVSFAPDSIIACFGAKLATGTEASNAVPLPTTLAGTRMLVRDSAGVVRAAPLFFVSPTQINYLLPTGTAAGTATITITALDGTLSGGQVEVTPTAAGIFTANANGRGVPAAILIRATGGTQRVEQVIRFDTATNSFVPLPINLGPVTDQVFLILFGSGTRYRAALNNVTCTIGGTAVDVGFAGAQGDLVGLDQINLGPLPRSLAGRGNVNLILTVEGRAANTVQVSIQ